MSRSYFEALPQCLNSSCLVCLMTEEDWGIWEYTMDVNYPDVQYY
jgi:hypothetical protein